MKLNTLFAPLAMTGLLITACSPGSDLRTDSGSDVSNDNVAVQEMSSPEDMSSQEITVSDPELIARIVSDDIAYLTRLGLMRGHLFVGVTLFREGEHAEAATHMKHPESELYAELQPGLEARGAEDFAALLETLAVAVENQESIAQVDLHYENTVLAIRQAEAATPELNAAEAAQVIGALLDNVAYEYEIAVDANGILINAHEYQDCLGFVQVANGYIDTLQERSDEPARIQGLRQQMAFLQEVFSTTVPSPREPLAKPATVKEVIERIGVTLAGFPI